MITSEQRADAVAILQRISEWLEGAAPWPLTPPRQFTVDGTQSVIEQRHGPCHAYGLTTPIAAHFLIFAA